MQEEQAQITRSFKDAKVRDYRNHRNWFVFFTFGAAMWTFAPVAWWQRVIAAAALAFFGFNTYRLNKGVRIWKRMPRTTSEPQQNPKPQRPTRHHQG
jgi:hypothetical protein